MQNDKMPFSCHAELVEASRYTVFQYLWEGLCRESFDIFSAVHDFFSVLTPRWESARYLKFSYNAHQFDANLTQHLGR